MPKIDRDTPVLIIDEFKPGVDTLRRYLQGIGFGLADYDHTWEAGMTRMFAAAKPYALVICDLDVVEVRAGIRFLKRVRNDDDLRGALVLITGRQTSPDDAQAAMDAGASGFIEKPFNASDLKAKIEQIFAASDSN